MINGTVASFYGFLVHIYPDLRKNRLYLLGRLTDGRSFAVVEENWRPYFHVFEKDYSKVKKLFKIFRYDEITPLDSFSGREKHVCFKFHGYNDRRQAVSVLEQEKISSPDAGIKPADLFLTEKQIRGPLCITGNPQEGKKVDLVFRGPEVYPPQNPVSSPLCVASIDIETDVDKGGIRAISIVWTYAPGNNIADNYSSGRVRIVSSNGSLLQDAGSSSVVFHTDEKSMLYAFKDDVSLIDPDILTGWNFLDFDFPNLAKRFEKYGLSFAIGRSRDSAKFFPGDSAAEAAGVAEATGAASAGWRRRSAAAIVPGRQVLDALRIMRAGTVGSSIRETGQGFSLDEIAKSVLGEGKLIHESGDEKIAALDRLYTGDPVRFAEYCLNDARLVLKILAKTGLYRLTVERACLTGVSLDKAWTSVASFERIYALQLRKHGIAPSLPDTVGVTGAAGGTVLESEAGFINNVAVFDFRSLYPSIIRTFNIDPLSHARADEDNSRNIVAPNGAAFSRKQGLLPALIGEYFAMRGIAIEKGDEIAAQVYKILMNSFYGVLGTSSCRYGKSALAGAITSFARKWLLFSRDWFNSKGLHVLYGDTDSLFVKTGFADIPLAEFEEKCRKMADEVNSLISDAVKKEYNLQSFLDLRFDKAYRRFLIPPVRNICSSGDSAKLKHSTGSFAVSAENRGRAKGYGGYTLRHDGLTVDVTGMEAVRSDTTSLARRLQLELLEMVFSGCSEDEYREKTMKTILELRGGKLDHELVYRKRLTRFPETYTSVTPPHVKAARALGWKKRRGAVEYLWTVNGPEPAAVPHGKPDYDHYVESQIFPLVRSIAAAMRWDADYFVMRKENASSDMQIELKF